MKFFALLNGKAIAVDVDKKNGSYSLTIADKTFTVNAVRTRNQMISLLVNGESYEAGVDRRGNSFSVSFYNDTIEFQLFEARKFKATEITRKSAPSGPSRIIAPMPGKVIRIAVAQNAEVKQGDSLVIIEAMKMQNELKAPRAGIVRQIQVKEGDAVSPSQVLLIVE